MSDQVNHLTIAYICVFGVQYDQKENFHLGLECGPTQPDLFSTVFENILSKLNPRNLPLFPPLKYGPNLLSKNSLSRSFNTQVILQHETSSNNYTKFYNTWRNKFWWLTPIKTLQKPNLYKYNWQGQSNMTCRGGTGENLQPFQISE